MATDDPGEEVGPVAVFAKAPVAGRVKTRLTPGFGYAGAATLYKLLLDGALARAVASGATERLLYCAPGIGHPWLRARARDHGAVLRPQAAGDLGARMHAAFREMLAEAPYAVIVGGDCAGLGADRIRAAGATLAAGTEVVTVPATDGGYVLIGLRRPEAALFRAMPWGSNRVMAQTRVRIRRLGLQALELPPAWDVDHPADVRRLRRAGGLPAFPCRRCAL